MTTACREQIVAHVKSVLAAATVNAVPVPVERNRREPLNEQDLPRTVLLEDTETDATLYVGEDGYELPLNIQAALALRGEAGAIAANDLRAQYIRLLKADVTLGGLARDIRFDMTGDFDGVELPSADIEGFQITAHVLYATAYGDPYTFA